MQFGLTEREGLIGYLDRISAGLMAEALGVKITKLGPVRASLIKKGMIYSPAHGDMAFTAPIFDEFMRRVMPDGGEDQR